MVFTFERPNYQEIRRMTSVGTKMMIGILILIYFGGSLVLCNADISFCKKRFEELRNDVKGWKKRCLNGTEQVLNSSCCEAEKKRNQERMKIQTQLCFYKGSYPEPYLIVNNNSEIHAIDLLTEDKTVVIRGLQNNYGMAIHKAEMKLYFGNDGSISRANLDGTGIEVFLQNADVWKMDIDWINRKLYWISYGDWRINVMYLDSKEKRALTNSITYFDGDIAVDPTVGYLFWTTYSPRKVQRMNLATNNIKTLVRQTYVEGIALDYSNKRVYWIEGNQKIFSSDYNLQRPKINRTGSFHDYMLSLSGDLLYFQTPDGEYPIIQVNMTTGNTVRSIPVNKGYNKLIVFHSSLQSIGKEGCPVRPCGPFSHCNKTNSTANCQCEIGFSGNDGDCTDIDECLTSVCGNKTFNNCTNFPGFYKCACGEGYVGNEKGCATYSDLQVRLVNSNNNNSGRVEIYHPAFGWGTVCGGHWTKVEGGVVCRQLSFTGAKKITTDSRGFGAGSGPILLDYVRCTGNELFIEECIYPGFNVYHRACSHSYDVGVDCY